MHVFTWQETSAEHIAQRLGTISLNKTKSLSKIKCMSSSNFSLGCPAWPGTMRPDCWRFAALATSKIQSSQAGLVRAFESYACLDAAGPALPCVPPKPKRSEARPPRLSGAACRSKRGDAERERARDTEKASMPSCKRPHRSKRGQCAVLAEPSPRVVPGRKASSWMLR